MSRTRERGNWARVNTRYLGTWINPPTDDIIYQYSEPRAERIVDEIHYRGRKKTDENLPTGVRFPTQGQVFRTGSRHSKGKPYVDGGPMTLQRSYYDMRPSALHDVHGFGKRRYLGRFLPTGMGINPTNGVKPFYAGLPTEASLASDGSKALRRYRPGKSPGDLGQFLRELNRIPTIPFDFLNLARRAKGARKDLLTFRNAGNEYLNVQFGWLPFVRSLQNMFTVAQNLDRMLSQLKRDNGRPVRRSGPLNSDVVHTSYAPVLDYPYPTLTIEMYASPNRRWRENYQVVVTKQWFSGRFQYWIPDIDSPGWSPRAIRHLFGVNPTPALLWEVLPWSWLIDYFADVGTILSNMSENAAENLVIDYAFLMTSRHLTDFRDHRITLNSGQIVRCQSRHVREYKLRTMATPYGFDLPPPALSEKQALILAALGISRFF